MVCPATERNAVEQSRQRTFWLGMVGLVAVGSRGWANRALERSGTAVMEWKCEPRPRFVGPGAAVKAGPVVEHRTLVSSTQSGLGGNIQACCIVARSGTARSGKAVMARSICARKVRVWLVRAVKESFARMVGPGSSRRSTAVKGGSSRHVVARHGVGDARQSCHGLARLGILGSCEPCHGEAVQERIRHVESRPVKAVMVRRSEPRYGWERLRSVAPRQSRRVAAKCSVVWHIWAMRIMAGQGSHGSCHGSSEMVQSCGERRRLGGLGESGPRMESRGLGRNAGELHFA